MKAYARRNRMPTWDQLASVDIFPFRDNGFEMPSHHTRPLRLAAGEKLNHITSSDTLCVNTPARNYFGQRVGSTTAQESGCG